MKVTLEFENEEEFKEYKCKLASERRFDPGDLHISRLHLRPSTKRSLKAANKIYLRDIRSMSNIELYRIPGISWQSVAEIVAVQLCALTGSLYESLYSD
jgi:DNA-directed RNA polymerase alpha subunit